MMKNFLSNIYYYFYYRFFDKYHIVNTRLAPGYHDKDTILIHAVFSIFLDFVEIELASMYKINNPDKKTGNHGYLYILNNIEYFSKMNPADPGTLQELEFNQKLKDVYYYIKIQRPRLLNKIDILENQFINEDDEHLKKSIHANLLQFENILSHYDEKSLCDIMKIRPNLWT